jgi:hypothetical protein
MSETPLKKLSDKDETLLFGEASEGKKNPPSSVETPRDNYGNPVSRYENLETLFWAEYRATTWPRVGKNCQMII